jgi:cytochrome c556
MDALDAALSVEAVDPTTVGTLTSEIGDACAACHEIYREQEPGSGEYRLRSVALR